MKLVFSMRRIWLVLGAVLTLAGCSGGEKAPTDASANGTASTPAATANPAATDPAAAPKAAPAEAPPQVAIETSMGKIVVQLDPKKAPITVENFLSYVEAGEYDQTIFHQVWKDYVIVAGTYDQQLQAKKPRTEIFNEADNGLRNVRGTIAMSRLPEARHSATRQFFFNMADNAVLDHQNRDADEAYGYCVFGTVVEGLDVLDRIGNVPVHDTPELEQIPVETVMINTVRRIR